MLKPLGSRVVDKGTTDDRRGEGMKRGRGCGSEEGGDVEGSHRTSTKAGDEV